MRVIAGSLIFGLLLITGCLAWWVQWNGGWQ
jgi:hypothetical protein